MHRLLIALLISLLLAAPLAAQEHPVTNTKIVPPHAVVLLEMLRAGGLVIFFRHGSTPDYSEPQITDFADCPRQRNLNKLGRAQSALIGDGFKALQIPVGDVVASPFCRCMDTARIAFGRVTAADEVRGTAGETMRAHFATPPKAGTNLVIVGHGGAGGLIGEEFLREGEAVVVKPLGGGKYELIARVRAEQWAQFLPENREPPPGAPRAP
ncbi:MAG: histidine phosphatase family protein [Reyranellaceae bacterium]